MGGLRRERAGQGWAEESRGRGGPAGIVDVQNAFAASGQDPVALDLGGKSDACQREGGRGGVGSPGLRVLPLGHTETKQYVRLAAAQHCAYRGQPHVSRSPEASRVWKTYDSTRSSQLCPYQYKKHECRFL